MKTKVIIGIIVVLLIGGYFISKKPSSNNSDSGVQDKVQEAVKKTLSQLDINSGVHCVMDKNFGVAQVDNVKSMEFYLHGDKVRYDGLMQNPDGKEVEMHVIDDGDYTYMWGDGVSPMGAGNGMKLKDEDGNSMGNGPIDIEELKESNFAVPGYKCSSWSPKESTFTPPENINFKDFSIPNMGGFQR